MTRHCDQCQQPFEPARQTQRFCCDKCRMKWHRENNLPGTVAGIRALKHGGWSITIHQTERPQLEIGTRVKVENTG